MPKARLQLLELIRRRTKIGGMGLTALKHGMGGD